MDAAEARQYLVRLLELNDDELTRGLLVLVHIDGLSQGDAAEVLGVSRATANARLGDLRQKAQNLAEEHV
jgi:DNA-directed RNA polymerase specialized sigma24 family protein